LKLTIIPFGATTSPNIRQKWKKKY
jgi:hypothetical protein